MFSHVIDISLKCLIPLIQDVIIKHGIKALRW